MKRNNCTLFHNISKFSAEGFETSVISTTVNFNELMYQNDMIVNSVLDTFYKWTWMNCLFRFSFSHKIRSDPLESKYQNLCSNMQKSFICRSKIMITSKTLTNDSPMQRPISPPTLETRLAHVNSYKKALRRIKKLLLDLVQDIFLHIWWWDERNNFC